MINLNIKLSLNRCSQTCWEVLATSTEMQLSIDHMLLSMTRRMRGFGKKQPKLEGEVAHIDLKAPRSYTRVYLPGPSFPEGSYGMKGFIYYLSLNGT